MNKNMVCFALSLGLIFCLTAGAGDPALVKQQYDAVKSQLDDGGDLMIVANVDGLVEAGIQRLCDFMEHAAANEPDATPVLAAMRKLPAFLKANGFFAIRGFGVSSVPVDNQLNTIKAFIGRDPAAAGLPLWRGLFGLQNIEMKTPAFLPADTAIVRTFAADPEQLWKIVRSAVTDLGTPENAAAFEQSLAMSTMMLGVPLDKLIGSIGGEGFISVQLSPTETVDLPLGEAGKNISIPTPSMLIGFAVKDNTLATLIKTRFCGEGLPATATETDGLDIITMNAAMPAPVPVQITFAAQSNLLLIGSSPAVIERALAAAKTGKGLLASEKFKAAFGSLPMKNNGLVYLSPDCTDVIKRFQEFAVGQEGGPDAEVNAALMKLFQDNNPQQVALVILNTRNGILVTGKTTQSGRDLMTGAVIAPIAMMAGVTMPAIVKARSNAQNVSCISNLKMIEAAKEQWAIENGMEVGAEVSPADITPYLMKFPSCPSGGSYILNPIGTPAACDQPGHTLE